MLEVDDVEVGPQAWGQPAPVGEPVQVRRLRGQPADGVAELQAGPPAAVPDPVGEDVGRDRGVADGPAVGAGIVEAEHGGGVGHLLEEDVVIAVAVVEQVQQQHRPGPHGVVGDGLDRGPGPLGEGPEVHGDGLLVVGVVTEDEAAGQDAVDEGLPGEGGVVQGGAVKGGAVKGGAVKAGGGLGEYPGADVGAGQVLEALGEREVVDGLVARAEPKRVANLPAEQHAEGPARHEGHNRGSFGAPLPGPLQVLAPPLGGVVLLQDDERRGQPGLGRQPAHPIHLRRDRRRVVGLDDAGPRHLEDGASSGPHGPPEGGQLGAGGVGARHGRAVQGRVAEGARRGKPEGARLDPVPHQPGHGRQLLGRGRLLGGGPVAHHVAADRAVGDLDADVGRPPAPLEDVEVLREGLPAPGDPFVEGGAGDVLDALHQLDEPLLRPGAHRREPDSAVAGHDGRDPVRGRWFEERVPRGLTVEMGVDIDEAGRDEPAIGVDDLGRLALEAGGHGDDPPVAHGDISLERRRPCAVDDGPTADDEVVHLVPPRVQGPAPCRIPR